MRLEPGDGLWATASGVGNYKLYFDEPAAGAAGVFALIQENGTPAILQVRLKVVGMKITEIETLVARKETTTFLNTDNLTAVRPVFLETVPAADRPSRAEMVAMVGKYFDGIEQGNGDIVPFDKDCIRIENGIQTCPGSPTSPLGALSCGAQLSTKIFTYIQSVSPRRFPIVDDGARAGAGDRSVQSSRHLANGRSTRSRQNDHGPLFAMAEQHAKSPSYFKVKDRKIKEISAVIVTQPYKAPTGWE